MDNSNTNLSQDELDAMAIEEEHLDEVSEAEMAALRCDSKARGAGGHRSHRPRARLAPYARISPITKGSARATALAVIGPP